MRLCLSGYSCRTDKGFIPSSGFPISFLCILLFNIRSGGRLWVFPIVAPRFVFQVVAWLSFLHWMFCQYFLYIVEQFVTSLFFFTR